MLIHIIVKDTRTMDMTIDQQVALDEALVPHGMYQKKNVDFAYLLWEDFVYQVVHKDAKKSNEMYYPRDDQMFTMIKLVSRHQNTQQFGVMLPIELTNEDIRNSEAYKEYYAVASGAAPLKTKASFRKMKSSFDTTITLSTAAGTRLSTSIQGKQPAKASKAKSLTVLSKVAMPEAEHLKLAIKRSLQQTHISQASGSGRDKGTGIILGVPDVPTEESDEEIFWKSSDEDDDDDVDDGKEETKDEESFDPIAKTPENSDDDENIDLNVGSEEGQDAKDDEDELYRDVKINLEGRVVQMTDVHTTQEFKDTHVTLTLVNPDGQQQSSSMSSQFVTSMLNPTLDAGIDSLFETTSQMDVLAPTTVASLILSAPTLTPLTIPTISTTDRLRDEAQAENKEFLKNLDENIQKIIKEQVKILIEKMKSNKSIYRSDEQMNLYKALVEAYESNKIILDTYEDIVTLKRRRDDDADKDEEPFAGSDLGSKRRREGKDPDPTSNQEHWQTTHDLEEPLHQEFETGVTDDQPIAEASQHPEWFQQQKKPLTPDRTWNKTLPATHGSIQPHKYTTSITKTKAADYGHIKWIEDLVPCTMWSQEPIVEWHNYKHLDWITVRRDDDKLYKFKEERFAFNVSLRMFTRSIVIQWRMEDLQLGIESYQKKLNLTKPDTYHSDLKRKEAYTAYPNPRGFIYQNKDNQNRLMRIDELHKFSDGMLNDV
nr:hypothetical protein [Tanacetum cinerariifolium]